MLDCQNITAIYAAEYAPKSSYEKVISNFEFSPKFAYMNAELKIKKDGVKIVYINDERNV